MCPLTLGGGISFVDQDRTILIGSKTMHSDALSGYPP
jgi:hypothetical protein